MHQLADECLENQLEAEALPGKGVGLNRWGKKLNATDHTCTTIKEQSKECGLIEGEEVPQQRLQFGPHLLQAKARERNTLKWRVVGQPWTEIRKSHDMTRNFSVESPCELSGGQL